MSDLRINIRLLQYHLQVADNWKASISYNDCHKNLEYGWFDVYEWNPLKNVG
jgi:hypothetical protein